MNNGAGICLIICFLILFVAQMLPFFMSAKEILEFTKAIWIMNIAASGFGMIGGVMLLNLDGKKEN